jgi:signal transduction histidine kinase/Na+/proline symporter
MIVATVLAAILLYVAILVAVARRADRRGALPEGAVRRSLLYFLSLTVYCTSWSYFTSIGDAATGGWTFLPYYIGPILAMTVLAPLWRRVATAAKREKIGSIADFLANRYGKSRPLGIMVTLVALITAVPHIALQLRALVNAWTLVADRTPEAPSLTAIVTIATFLTIFSLLLGGRRADLTESNRGLLYALAIQGVVKLLAMLVIALVAIGLIGFDGIGQALRDRPLAHLPVFDELFFASTFLGLAALYCFPKQFHVAFVELRDIDDIRVARYLLPLYLMLVAAVVVPIVAAGAVLGHQAFATPSLYVLSLSVGLDQPMLVALVAIGSFSAAASLIVVETIALSAMISNEMVLPWMTWRAHRRAAGAPDFSAVILSVRRITMGTVLGAACIFLLITTDKQLSAIGTASFVAASQLMPMLVGAVYWQRASLSGSMAGLTGGMLAWAWCGFAYGATGTGYAPAPGAGSLMFTIQLSLVVNVSLYVIVSLLAPTRMIDRVQARSYVRGLDATLRPIAPALTARTGDLFDLVSHFIGEERARQSFAQVEHDTGDKMPFGDRVTPATARAAERMLAGAIGSSSARGVIAAALATRADGPADVVAILDDAAHAVEFSRGMLQATLDNLDHGVCVLDEAGRLKVWNTRFLDMLVFSGQQISVDCPWALIVGWIDAKSVHPLATSLRAAFTRRKQATDHHERHLIDGRTLRLSFGPMGDGGSIITIADITLDRARAAQLQHSADALERANETLEARVSERTRALTAAKARAERADESKTRFLAAASHDLLQPLHAARLFTGALREDLRDMPQSAAIAANVDKAIGAADGMLRALLNLARLDALDLRPDLTPVPIAKLLTELAREFGPSAREKGLRLRIVQSDAVVLSDYDLLRSLLQNLVTNAIRYSDRGGILIGCRPAGDAVRIEIWDTGRGIAAGSQQRIFDEFVRLDADTSAGQGAGLGLAIVQQIATRLDHRIQVRSRPGRGSVFGVLTERAPAPAPALAVSASRGATDLSGMRILCLDDDATILDGLRTLLARWGADVSCVANRAALSALPDANWEVALIDYRIADDCNGLDILADIAGRVGCAALVTADTDPDIADRAARLDAVVLRKPIAPATLRDFLIAAYRAQILAIED